MPKPRKARRLADAYAFPGFRPLAGVQGMFGDPQVRLVTLVRPGKNDLRGLRYRSLPLVRPQASSGTGSALRRPPHLPRPGGAARGLPPLRGED